jgi:hypothetical protein
MEHIKLNYSIFPFLSGLAALKNLEPLIYNVVDSSWNVMAYGDTQEGKWRWNWRMVWVASALHTTSEHGVSIVTTADVHTLVANSRLNWRLCRFKWTPPFHQKTKSGFCECAITFQLASNNSYTICRVSRNEQLRFWVSMNTVTIA